MLNVTDRNGLLNKDETPVCAGCGLALDSADDPGFAIGELRFCGWCWSNDCCRISRDAAKQDSE